MKKYSILLLALVATLVSCEDRRGDLGDLAGMWQMTQWRDTTDSVVATKEDAIYYSFENYLMKVHRIGDDYHLARFTHTGDSLIVTEAYSQPFDSIVPVSDLRVYGVPEDGRFHVDALSDDRMQLSGSEGTLSFRKY